MLRRKRFWVLIILFVLTLGASFFAYRWGRDFTANQVSAIFDPLQPVAVATQTGPITDTTV